MIVVVIAGLARSAPNSAGGTSGSDPDLIPGAGLIVRSEVLHIWLPDTLLELASSPIQQLIVHEHDPFRRFLERRSQENIRYAVTIRGHLAGGGRSDITFIRHPYDDPRHFQELSAILDSIDGGPIHDALDLSKASVHRVSDELLLGEPSEVLGAMWRIDVEREEDGRAGEQRVETRSRRSS